ncbi:MAG: 4'-phosphopantetheinyl transferase superfamily protein [Bacilli bacterium]|nr:4'-phosphopantetheinyl transferase superfamily protein [Bacilli bacterium]
MKNNHTYIFYSKVDVYDDKPLFNQHLNIIDEERRKYVLSYKIDEDQYRSLGVYILYLKALEILKLKEDKIIYNNQHKPDCTNYHINFSHSGNYVCVAISSQSIGIDIEKVNKLKQSLLKHCFSPLEQDFIKQDDLSFFRMWTLKESYLKALGYGISKRLDSFEIDITKMRINNPLSLEEYHLKEYQIDKEYCLSVCYQTDNIDLYPEIDLKK